MKAIPVSVPKIGSLGQKPNIEEAHWCALIRKREIVNETVHFWLVLGQGSKLAYTLPEGKV